MEKERYFELLAEKYPTQQAVCREIINLFFYGIFFGIFLGSVENELGRTLFPLRRSLYEKKRENCLHEKYFM